jgi:DNA-binding transcriptional ArsR family regulator
MHDPSVLRAIAHPLRNRILGELTATGPMRAADIARELDVPANQASFHLRQLAKYGLVEEDPAAARDRRDRVWRAAGGELTLHVADMESQPGGAAAARVYMANSAAEAHTLVEAAYGGRRDPGTTRTTMQSTARLTKAEATALAAELAEVAERWTERTRGADDGAERLTYVLHTMLLPHPPLAEPGAGDD